MDILAIQIVLIYCNVDNRICYKKNICVHFFLQTTEASLKINFKIF